MTDALRLPGQAELLPFWPPNNSDLNLLNYYVWSVVERVTNKSRHPNVMLLRTAIEHSLSWIALYYSVHANT